MNKVNDLMRQGCRVYKIPGLSKAELTYITERLFLNTFYDEERQLLFVKTNYES